MSTTRRPTSATSAPSSSGAEVDSMPAPEPSDEEVQAAKQRAVDRDLDGWVNWLARPTRKIAIIGFTMSRDEAPWGDPEWEIWICNNLALHLKPEQTFHRIYDLHDYATISSDKPHEAYLRTATKPVVVWQPRPEWPSSVAFPKDEINGAFGRYFSNSISWMIAHAIFEGATDLHVYGVDMAQGCLAPDTRVLTADLRWVRHDEVQEGDKLLAFDEFAPGDGKYRKFRTATVEAVRSHVQHCFRVTFADGTKIIASDDHPWLVNSSNTRRWLTTDSLEPETLKRRPSRVVKPFEPWEQDRSWGAGYLSAAVDAEGHLSSRSMGFSQRDNAFARQVISEAARRGYRFEGKADATGCVKYALAGGKREVVRFLGEIRPARLLDGFRCEQLGAFNSQGNGDAGVAVVSIEDIGMHETIGLQVDTRTYIAEGFATHNSEYAAQRPSCEYFLGMAAGRGINVYVPATSDLLKVSAMYGIEDDSALRIKLEQREKELLERQQMLSGQQNQIVAHLNQIAGALENTRYFRSVWINPAANRDGSKKTEAPEAPQPVGA